MLTERHLETLTSISSIEKLFDFLRGELHWPIEERDVEDLTFSYDPKELGIKDEFAPNIKRVLQIRPITGDQPWGIFFIDFENKKLPVTLMRRILNHLRVKNRGRTGQWAAGDLLFMTTYGREADAMREVAFAHFHQQLGDLPTLNVLQWDALDSPAKLKTTYESLRTHLGWPIDTNDKEAWRKQWRRPFRRQVGHVIKTAKGLADKLAELSRNIRDSVTEVLDAETEHGQVTKLYMAFKESLIHDLKPNDFADTFAQTITYGLFSAAVSRRYPEEKGSKSLTTETISEIVPETNPFLREVLATFLDVGGRKKGGIDFDELGVQEVVELLRSDETDMRAILEDFGNRKQGEDPVIHFYEDYLKAYNKELKVKRGVFYTPKPVVSYIVRSVHELLQAEFGLEDGLASTITWGEMITTNTDLKLPEVKKQTGEGVHRTKLDEPFVVILDPAVGTATFLVEVIEVIHKTMLAKWKAQKKTAKEIDELWNAYVPDCLLPRLYGYELMMAPYAIAHMKVGLKLGETGYRFGSSQRVRIYLTNALEPASELQARLALDWEALAHEAMAVKAVKETQRFTVVIGNPPYSGHSANASKDEKGNRNFIGNLVHDYYFVDGVPLGEKNPKWLQDDYVKFLRFGQYLIQQTGVGALGFITNHGYLDNPTFRGMRRSLMQSFDELRFLDLHGNANKKEVAPDGSKDENVFDIMQGVAVCMLTQKGQTKAERGGQVIHDDLFGTRERKYADLSALPPTVGQWEALSPNKPFYLFAEQDQHARVVYEIGWKVTEICPVNVLGFQSHRDQFAIGFTEDEVRARFETFRSRDLNDDQARESFDLEDNRDWQVPKARALARTDDLAARIVQCAYRPLDTRWCYFGEAAMDYPRRELVQHVGGRDNLCLNAVRQTRAETWAHAMVSSLPAPAVYVEIKDGSSVFPLYLYPSEPEVAMGIGKEPNLSPAFLDALAGAIGRRFESGGSSAGPGGLFAGGAEPSTHVGAGQEHLPAGQNLLGAPQKHRGEPQKHERASQEHGGEPQEHWGEPQKHEGEPQEHWGEPQKHEGERQEHEGAWQGYGGELLPEGSFSPEDVFHYIYAVLHSPAYRSRYAEFLKIDFPRIPLPGSAALFDALVPLGAELVALHLMESPRLDTPMTVFVGVDHIGDVTDMVPTGPDHLVGVNEMVDIGPRVEKVTFANGTVWIDGKGTAKSPMPGTRGFQGVPEEVWNFRVGGYQVCEKWLKDRGPKKGKPGRILSAEDIEHYHKIVVALSETIRIMKEIDEVIESHGAWPGAFEPGAC